MQRSDVVRLCLKSVNLSHTQSSLSHACPLQIRTSPKSFQLMI